MLQGWSRRLDEKAALRRKRAAEDRGRGFYGSGKRLRLQGELPAAAAQGPKSREEGRVVMFHRVRRSKEMVGDVVASLPNFFVAAPSGSGQTWAKHESRADPDASILSMYKK